MRTGVPILLAISALASCLRDRQADFPFNDLTGITQISVKPADSATMYFITDSSRVGRFITKLATHASGWHDSWHTQPAGDLIVILYRNNVPSGVVWVGPGFLAGSEFGQRLLLDIDAAEEQEIRRMLAPTAASS